MRLTYFALIFPATLLFYINLIFSSSYSPDSMRVLALRVEFQEDNATTTTGNGLFDLSQPSGPYQIDPPPHNRSFFQDHILFLKNYFYQVSAGELVITGDVFPREENTSYQLGQPMTFYNPNLSPEENNAALASLFYDAIRKADEDSEIDFSRYDAFIIFHAGVGKDVDLGFDETPQDIPSLFITSQFLQTYLGISGVPVQDNSLEISSGIIVPETESQAGVQLGLNGILTSNFGSQLGLPDLFSPETRRSGIGRFGLMDVGLFNGDGLLPAIPCAWSRLDAGWAETTDVYYAQDDLFTVSYPLGNDAPRIYRVPISENEYFLVENRYAGKLSVDSLQYTLSQGRSEYPTMREVLETYFTDEVIFSPRGVLTDARNPDLGLPGNGCLIWHINENVIRERRASNSINADPEHRGVDLEEADGSQDIGQAYDFLSPGYGSEIGYVLDMWYKGNTSPIFKNDFSSGSIPNSRSYYNRANSHIKIFDFSSPDSLMSLRVSFDFFQQYFPFAIDSALYGKISFMKTSDIDYDGRGELLLFTSRGYILIVSTKQIAQTGDSLITAAMIGESFASTPVLFDDHFYNGSTRTKALIIPSVSGQVYGFVFPSIDITDTLFTPLEMSTPVTTYPVTFYDTPDSLATVVWGLQDGTVYQLEFSHRGIVSSSQKISDESVRFLHVNGVNQIIAISESGKVYRDGVFLRQSVLPYFSPVGDEAAGLTRDGKFLLFESKQPAFAENSLYRFDSPMITNPFLKEDNNRPQYFVAGNNRLFSFNYNFTQFSDFPTRLFDPDRDRPLPFSPLFNNFFADNAREEFGAVVTDPSGLIDAFDLNGKRFPDFPISVGDSILVAPVITDLDGDGDLELAAITRKNVIYVWDFASGYEKYGWNQPFYDELNSNRNNNPLTGNSGLPDNTFSGDQLLPEKGVYNWPNPNQENFTFIRYFLTAAARVNIKVYDLAGDLVTEFRGGGNGGTANEIRWDLNDIQTGVYFARVEAQSDNRKEVRIIKIAVVK
jgi:M6 family metalloprotease-like protein